MHNIIDKDKDPISTKDKSRLSRLNQIKKYEDRRAPIPSTRVETPKSVYNRQTFKKVNDWDL